MRRALAEAWGLARAFAEGPGGAGPLTALLTEPGLAAVLHHRFAHQLWFYGQAALARGVAELARRQTGISLHPSVRLGREVRLEGPGIVVGPGVEIGDRAVVGPGAVLWGIPGEAPRIGPEAVVGARAVVTGECLVGEGADLAPGAIVSRDVPAFQSAASPAVLVGGPEDDLEGLPAAALAALAARQLSMEEQLQILAFNLQRFTGQAEPFKTRSPVAYGPLPAMGKLLDAWDWAPPEGPPGGGG